MKKQFDVTLVTTVFKMDDKDTWPEVIDVGRPTKKPDPIIGYFLAETDKSITTIMESGWVIKTDTGEIKWRRKAGVSPAFRKIEDMKCWSPIVNPDKVLTEAIRLGANQ